MTITIKLTWSQLWRFTLAFATPIATVSFVFRAWRFLFVDLDRTSLNGLTSFIGLLALSAGSLYLVCIMVPVASSIWDSRPRQVSKRKRRS